MDSPALRTRCKVCTIKCVKIIRYVTRLTSIRILFSYFVVLNTVLPVISSSLFVLVITFPKFHRYSLRVREGSENNADVGRRRR